MSQSVSGKAPGEGRRAWIVSAIALVSSLVALLSMAVGRDYLWPDFVHTDYGIPLVWGTHVVDTFIGPVDKWQINYANLGGDLVFWLAVVAALTFAARHVVRPRSPTGPAPS